MTRSENLGDRPYPAKVLGEQIVLCRLGDRVIVENRRPEEIPLNLAEEFHLKAPDALAPAYRQFMQELGVE